ncbi:MAG: DHH family phosphoesterase [Myxococcota bacterium]
MSPADAIFDALLGCGSVLLTGPVGPDGDSIGACLALARVLRARGVEVWVAGTPPDRYRWMPGATEMIPDDRVARLEARAVVILDGDRHRLHPAVSDRFAGAALRGIIDHHASTAPDGYTHAWLDAAAESTCGMVLRALPGWGVAIDRPLAELLYTGLLFDTGGFRHSNTSPEALRLAADLVSTGIDHAAIAIRILHERSPAALHAMGRILADASPGPLCVGRVPWALQQELALRDGDLEGVVDALVNTVGAEVGALLIERPDGTVKYSLRSRGGVDVAQLARALHPTGGGHPRAAGASTLPGSTRGIADAERRLRDAIATASASDHPRRPLEASTG